MSQDYTDGYAVTVAQTDGRWQVREFDDDFTDLSTSVSAVRKLRAEGASFALLNVEEDYLVIVRPGPSRVRLLISDATMAVDDDFAADICDEADVEIPDIDPDELDNVDGWADGDFAILADLGLSEERLSILLDDDADPADLAQTIADELGFGDELADVVD
ncbi:tRNA adenosine deaminase-associated protein [Corynebacterium lujinxingii]|uniref:tRNA adenosine deaminase-associated protein n=1 Tax=Corynebacterium lujinxingii TaxID=2763010 RepID=A0A7H0JZ59_9CORY|nr:tRNA adenosine deaminase-associated protein [Corynebacterium lujinxingii]MBC3179308.1 tRNA adenosine deaminase-associated protein [Corynebacterium lujinxingii]NNO10183.1 tRNA adenosine deaminase [Corynebacterium lujinxingii]QNP90325.1 tRNA adenosine deaminase-associated protein [Corynebacterium lujinxingii]